MSQLAVEKWKAFYRVMLEKDTDFAWAPLSRRIPTADELYNKLDMIGR